MKRNILIILLLLIFTLTTGCKAVEGNNHIEDNELEAKENEEFETIKNMTWIWDAVEHLNTQTLVDASEVDINMISINGGFEPKYTGDNIYLRGESEKYETFISKANESNIQVNALFGTPEWAKIEHRDYMMVHIEEVLNYNKKHKNAGFSGIHLDIEPHGLPEWNSLSSSSRNALIEGTIANIKEAKKAIENHNKENKDNLQLLIDIAPAVPEYRAYIDEFFGVADTIVLMNYTKIAKDYLDNPKDYLEAGVEHNKKVIVGSEFQDEKEYENISLYGMSRSDVEKFLEDGLLEFDTYSSFGGLGFHELYDYYHHRKN